MMEQNRGLIFLGVSLALGVATAGYFVGQTMYNAKVAINTAEVKGLAERRVVADRAEWSIVYTVTGATRAAVPELYREAERQQKAIIALLTQNGFAESEINAGVLDYTYTEYRDDKQVLVDQAHSLSGTISVETEKVDQVAKGRAAVNALIADGFNIDNQAPRYRFTKLNDIKPAMLEEATRNARIAANEFATNAGVRVGGIRSALQGGFNIRDAGEEFGDTAKLEKDVRVVTTITFYLTD